MDFLSDEAKEQIMKLMDDGLEFPALPKDILCSNCGVIPLFHYIYPCSHPYCRNCYEGVFERHKKKCRVCKSEIGTKKTQSQKIESAINNLPAICPNKSFGCNDVITLSGLLRHLEECTHSKENQLAKIQSEDKICQESEINYLKTSLADVKVIVNDLVKRNANSDKREEDVLEDVKRLSADVHKLTDDVVILMNANETMYKSIVQQQQYPDNHSSDESMDQASDQRNQSVLTETAATTAAASIKIERTKLPSSTIERLLLKPEVMEVRFRNLENAVSDMCLSQMAIKNNVEQYMRIIVDAQLIPGDQPVIRETLLERMKETRVVNLDSDLGKMIVSDLHDFKEELKQVTEKMAFNKLNRDNHRKSIDDIQTSFKDKLMKLEAEINSKIDILNATINSTKEELNTNIVENELMCRKKIDDLHTLVNSTKEDISNDFGAKEVSHVKKINDINAFVNSTKKEIIKTIDEKELLCGKKIENLIASVIATKSEITNDIDEKVSLCNERICGMSTLINSTEDDIFKIISEKESKCNLRIDQIRTIVKSTKEEITKNIDDLTAKVKTTTDISNSNKKEIATCKTGIIDLTATVNTTNANIQKALILNDKVSEVDLTLQTIQTRVIPEIKKQQLTIQDQTMDSIAKLKVPKNGVLIWEIKEFAKKMASGNDLYSDEFYSSEFGYKMKMKAAFEELQLEVFLMFVPGENDNHLPAVFHHREIYYVLDQSDRKDKRHVVRIQESRFRDGMAERFMKETFGFSSYFLYSLLEIKHKDVYLKKDRMFLKVVVEPIFPLPKSPFSDDGTLVWKVFNYQRTKQESLGVICFFVHSNSFYSSPHGYRMKCCLSFGLLQLQIWLYFLEGEFDDALSDIYPHKVTFSILKQIGNSKENELTEVRSLDPKEIGNEKATERMSAYGCSRAHFFSSAFEKMPFLVDDSILLKIKVDPM